MLLHSHPLNGCTLRSRIVMAPLTRCAATEGHIPTPEMAAYYADRASVGLVIAEATCISACANAYPKTPGIYTEEQVKGWRVVTEAVHSKGGKIFLQLWHAGMMGHSTFRNGDLPLSPSGIAPLRTRVPRSDLPYEKPRPMERGDFIRVLELFAQAGFNAKTAGFDGVELHGAGGYLLDSFLHHHTNRRSDSYGKDKGRFLLEIVDALSPIIQTGIRLSPTPLEGMENMVYDRRDLDVFRTLFKELEWRKLAYLHAATDEDSHQELGRVTEFIRTHYRGTLIGGGGYTPITAQKALVSGDFDLVSFGRLLLANPNLVALIKQNKELRPFDHAMVASPPALSIPPNG